MTVKLILLINRAGITPLHLALRNRNPEIAQLLVSHRGDPNTPDSNGASSSDLLQALERPARDEGLLELMRK